MSSSHLISPFAEKFLLPGNKAPRATGWNGRLPYYFDLDNNLHWHLTHNLGNPSFIALLNDLPTLSSEPLPTRAAHGQGTEMPPRWNLPKADGTEELYEGPSEGEPNDGADLLAYYVPAHNLTPTNHGIHLLGRGIAHLAAGVQTHCPDQPIEVLGMAAAFLLLGHEYCHAWIEDLCCLVDFSVGNGVTPAGSRRYAQSQQRWGGYIEMEEALCNTAAWGWLDRFLNSAGNQRVQFDAAKVTNAFYRWLRNSPPGYRDFLAIRSAPGDSPEFLGNIQRLLIEVYDFDRRDVPDAAALQAHHRPAFAIFSGPHAPLHLEH